MDEIRIQATQSLTPPEERPDWYDDWTGTRGPFAIRLREEAFRAIHAHAATSLDEVGGLLVGKAVLWEGTLYIDVEIALAGEQTKAGPTHVTFTADTWAALMRRQEAEYPDRWVVGWYHSHPRMQVFLSDMDVALQRHFFPQPWHVAVVVNAQDDLTGCFGWAGSEIQPVSEYLLAPAPSEAAAGESETGADAHEPERVPPSDTNHRPSLWLWTAALLAGALVLAYWASKTSERES